LRRTGRGGILHRVRRQARLFVLAVGGGVMAGETSIPPTRPAAAPRPPATPVIAAALLAGLAALTACSGRSPSAPTTSPYTIREVTVQGPLGSYTGRCPVTINFYVTVVAVAQSGTYEFLYQWESNDGTQYGPFARTIVLNAPLPYAPPGEGLRNGSGPVPVEDHWPAYGLAVSSTVTGWLRLHITSPSDVTSAPAAYSVTCSPN
jgi:hypothetical protein